MKLNISPFVIFTALAAVTAFPAQAQRQAVDQFYEGKLTFSPEEEDLYLKRYAQAINRVAEDELYTPLEAMARAVGWKPLPVAKAT